MKWLDKMFDSVVYWLENVQWNRDARRRARERKKNAKASARIKKKIDNAKKVLKDNGHTFERNWQNIEYKGERYTPTMIEEVESDKGDIIIIHAIRIEQGE